MPLSRRHSITSGYGLRRVFQYTTSGLNTNATSAMQPNSTKIRCPYSRTIFSKPVSATVDVISPMMPKGAKRMMPRTMLDTAAAQSPMISWVALPALRSGKPKANDHAKIPM